MRLISKLLAGSAAVAVTVALSAGPALADPPGNTVPKATDVVGVGSDTIEFLFDQVSHNYDASHSNPSLYSWDATNPKTGAIGDNIVTKQGCAAIARPDGSSAGITQLDQNTADGSNFCVDYARSSRGRTATDPPYASGGIAFTNIAGDAVTYATRSSANGGTNAPANLSLAQLKNIYLCKTTNWDKVGGPNAPIDAFLPQTSSGTRSFFLTALGGGTTAITPGACVSDVNNTLEENEGVDPALNDANAIFPYSVADYIAQVYHDAACTNATCTGSPACAPKNQENLFGCNQSGVLTLNKINGTAPTKPWPLRYPPKAPAINKQVTVNTGFSSAFQRTVYEVVRYSASTSDHIPSYLEPLFGSSGYICSTAGATIVKNYGFLVHPTCGSTN